MGLITSPSTNNSSRYGTTPTKQPLGNNKRPQASRGTGEAPWNEADKDKDRKREETAERSLCPEEGKEW